MYFFQEKEIKYPELTVVSLHGSLLLQQMLQFGNPKVIVTSLLNLKPSELRTMSCDPCGSHVIETFFTSPTIGEKSHDAFYLRMKVCVQDCSFIKIFTVHVVQFVLKIIFVMLKLHMSLLFSS